ncbi:MAG: Swt1 family HEPN domain-containing protein [Gammaproteobacteria bacterium]|nr:Swt1 family HEPN domain-containing protein [Gammaproteobacteria bacterium]
MAISNHERVGKALDLLRTGLGPFVEREIKSALERGHGVAVMRGFMEDPMAKDKPVSQWDTALLLKAMWESWNEVFRQILGPAERSLVGELRGYRNRWAHQETFSGDDADRALDSSERLLAAVSAPEAEEVKKMKMELRRLIFDEQVRSERRKSSGSAIESAAAGALKPWREVIAPHRDVASGRYQQAEFAADLWQVHLGEGTDEYRDPVEFFRRTYLTESLRSLLVGAVQRITGQGGDPVVQLQTNFGGGKTHSMLALYHLFSGTPAKDLVGIEAVLEEAAVETLPTVKPVVLVGNKISPGNPATKPDGTVIHTLWGELAWQLGGQQAYERVRHDDERATSPGDVIRELFKAYGPCLVLVDEWVAYARQLHDDSDLPAGGFETQFSFAQVLTESAKLAGNCLLVISLPASDVAGSSPHAQADDVEVGGARGREALDRLRNVVGRVESSWRPASAEEGFEIVRRRLFEPLVDPAHFKDRDVVARAFADLYRTQHQEFPAECRDSDYEKRIRAAYPIHPEVFDRLYTEWSTLVKFQRTRGVLRLMAAVIHSLWEKGDRNPLIMPANIPIDDRRVQSELTRYLSDNWVPIIEKDVDGPSSLPMEIDGHHSNLGKYAACRRVARTIYMGSAPTPSVANRGLEDRRVKLGCVMPGESPAIFGDALRRLAGAATYLYQDGPRYWYSTQPTVTKLAEDRAEQLKRDPDKVIHELEQRLRKDLATRGDFPRIHPLPATSSDVPDDLDARLVVLGIDQPYSKEAGNAAVTAAKGILESRGTTPRLYRNTLVFLAADKSRYQDLDDALRRYVAWDSILAEKDTLDLSPHQVKQAETQKGAVDGAVVARLPETYQWLLVPVQETPQAAIEWLPIRLSGRDALAVRASRKLKSEELLIAQLAGTRLRMELDRVPLWRGDHVSVHQLVEDFARYLYLPRLQGPHVLAEAVQDGVKLLTWPQDTFAYADSHDEAAQRYRGLRGGQLVSVDEDSNGLLVLPEVAQGQLREEEGGARPDLKPSPGGPDGGDTGKAGGDTSEDDEHQAPARPTRFHGTVDLSPERAGRDAGRIAEEVIAHLSGVVGTEVTVTLEIEAHIPDGASEQLVRTVIENARTLKFKSQGFETE